MKNCKFCDGRGYTFDGTEYQSTFRYGLTLVNIKIPCKKCYGKGMK